MIKPYVGIHEHLPKLENDELDPLLLSRQKSPEVDGTVNVLLKLDIITVCLQKKNFTMVKVSVLCDSVVGYMPQTRLRLYPDANIVKSVAFEAALFKVKQGRENDLKDTEQSAVECLVESEVEASTSRKEDHSLVDIAFSKFRAQQNKLDTYLDTRFIAPASNLREGLCSQARRAFTNWRKRMIPTKLESQMFHYTKRRF